MPWGFYIYNVRSPTSWILFFSGFSAMSIPDRLRVSVYFMHMLYWWFTLDFFVRIFRRGIQSWLSNLMEIYAEPGMEVPAWSSWWYPLFLSVAYSFSLCSFFVSWNCSCPLVPFWKGIQSFQRDHFMIVSYVPGILFLTFWSCCLCMKKVSRAFFRSLWRDLFFVGVFPLIL